MTDYAESIISQIATSLGTNALFDSMDTTILNETPEEGTCRSNTIYMIRHGPMLEERLHGTTDIYSVRVVTAFFMKPSEKKYAPGYSVTTERLDGEKLTSAAFMEMTKVLDNMTFTGINVAGHEIEDQNQSNAVDSGLGMYVAEIITKTKFEA